MRRNFRHRVKMKGLSQSGAFPSGNPRYYYRTKGDRAIAMPDAPKESPQFLKAYADAVEGRSNLPIKSPRAGTISAGILAYQKSERFRDGLAASTRANRRNILKKIDESYGRAKMADLQPKHIKADLSKLGAAPALNRFKVWSALSKYWHDMEWVALNPTSQISKPKLPASDGHKPWTLEDVAKFRAHWPIGSMQRFAMELMLHTGAAISDALKLGPGNVKDGWLTYKRQKSGGISACPMVAPPAWFAPSEHLQECIDVAPRHMIYLSTSKGHSRSPKSAQQWFSKAARDAGLGRGKTSHGIRKLKAILMTERGAIPEQRMAILGHDTTTQTQEYSKSADAKRIIMQRNISNFSTELEKTAI